MNTVKLALAATFLAISTSSVQADTGSPSILSSVSANSAETLSNADASKTRGQFRNCTFFNTICYDQHTQNYHSSYVDWFSSSRYVSSYTDGLGRNIYVAR